MSENPQGPGWWQADDGMWYPPRPGTVAPEEEAIPEVVRSAPRPPTPRSAGPTAAPGPPAGGPVGTGRPRRGLLVALAGAVALVVVLVVVRACSGGTDAPGDPAPAEDTATTTVPPSSSTTSSTSSTTTTTPAPVLPAPATGVVEGAGDATLELAAGGARVLYLTHSGEGDFVVSGLDAAMVPAEVLVSTTGAYSGAVALDFIDGQQTPFLSVGADGPWRAELVPVESLVVQEGAIGGVGDAVLFWGRATGPAVLSHDGTGAFSVRTHAVADRSVQEVVSATGTYSGTVDLVGPSFVVVRADGAWSVTPS